MEAVHKLVSDSILQHVHIHVLADFFQYFWRIFCNDPVPNIVIHHNTTELKIFKSLWGLETKEHLKIQAQYGPHTTVWALDLPHLHKTTY